MGPMSPVRVPLGRSVSSKTDKLLIIISHVRMVPCMGPYRVLHLFAALHTLNGYAIVGKFSG